MVSTQFSITLPDEIAARIRAKVASGRYASESEVVLDALEELEDRDQSVEDWLRAEVVLACEAYRRDPSNVLTVDQLRDSLGLPAGERAGAG